MEQYMQLANDLQLSGWDYFALLIIGIIVLFFLFYFINFIAKTLFTAFISIFTVVIPFIIFAPFRWIWDKIDRKINM